MTARSSIFGIYCLRMIAGWAIIHGLLTCIGGPTRWSTHVYSVVELIPGSPFTWGIVYIISGIILLVASLLGPNFRKNFTRSNFLITYAMLKNASLKIIAGACLLFAIGVVVASTIYPDISLAAATRDIFIACLCIMMTKSVEPDSAQIRL